MDRKRAAGEGSIRQRHHDLWEARVQVRGKRVSVYGATRQEVQRKLREAKKAVEEHRPIPSHRLTVGKLVDQWLAVKRPPALEVTTYRGYQEKVRNHVVPAWGSILVMDLTPGDVEAYLSRQVRKGLSPSTARHVRRVLRAALGWGIKQGVVSRNVAQLADPPKHHAKAVEPLDTPELEQFLQVAQGDRLDALYGLELALGLRSSELLGLTWRNVDLQQAVVHIRTTLIRDSGVYILRENGKTSESLASMPLPIFAVDALAHHRERQEFEKKAVQQNKKQWGNDWDLVFTTKVGAPLNSSVVCHHFQKLLLKAGLPRKRFYDLRHTSASLLFDAGADMLDVKEHLRHSQISLTANTYTHLFEQRKRHNAEKMDAALRQLMG